MGLGNTEVREEGRFRCLRTKVLEIRSVHGESGICFSSAVFETENERM